VVGHPHIRFYAGVRLMIEGFAVRTLCVSDNNPKIFNCVQIQQLEQ
ncbi:MAG TPA: diguanylate cyclase, partial [Alteromonas macleodii]|nr:diguanylate cyclase [Alteromonas macleodii]